MNLLIEISKLVRSPECLNTQAHSHSHAQHGNQTEIDSDRGAELDTMCLSMGCKGTYQRSPTFRRVLQLLIADRDIQRS